MKSILVEEVYQIHGMASVSAPEDAPLEEVITRFAHEPGLRSTFLVDSRQRFAGVITHIDLLKWASFRLFQQISRRRDVDAGEVFRIVFATKAKDLAHGSRHSLGVKPSDTLQTAPVLDNEGRILGDLRLSEVLSKAVEAGRQARQ